MKKVFEILKTISATIGALAALAGLIWGGFLVSERLFTSEEMRERTEKNILEFDPVKAYGEYIMDSIEEANTQIWRLEQVRHDSIQDRILKDIDSLLRLNIKLTNETKKTAKQIEEGH